MSCGCMDTKKHEAGCLYVDKCIGQENCEDCPRYMDDCDGDEEGLTPADREALDEQMFDDDMLRGKG